MMERKNIFPKITDLSSAQEFVDRRLQYLKNTREEAGQVVLHFIPLEQKDEIPLINLVEDIRRKPVIHGRSRWIEHGLKIFEMESNKETAYAIYYFDGPVEIWNTTLLVDRHADRPPCIPSTAFEKDLIYSIDCILDLVRKDVIVIPALLVLSLLNVKGFDMATKDRWFRDRLAIENDDVIIANVIKNANEPPHAVLQYFFNRVWNACGYDSSKNYDAEGNWKP